MERFKNKSLRCSETKPSWIQSVMTRMRSILKKKKKTLPFISLIQLEEIHLVLRFLRWLESVASEATLLYTVLIVPSV